MRKTLKTLLVTTAFGLIPAIGMAQDWAGPYGGLTLGYGFGDADHSFSNAAPSDNSDPDGALFGGFLGYGFQSGNMVYGAEVDAEFNNFAGSFVNSTGATSGGTTTGDWQASVRAKVGLSGQLRGKPALYYATAGWAAGKFDFLGGPSAAATNGYSDTLNGWTAGLGMDWRVSPKTAVRLEYRYTDFGTSSGTLAPAFPGVTMPVDVTQHAIRLGTRIDF
jgi:outer membrane immunogenic protein